MQCRGYGSKLACQASAYFSDSSNSMHRYCLADIGKQYEQGRLGMWVGSIQLLESPRLLVSHRKVPHGLSSRRAQSTKSRGPLEVGPKSDERNKHVNHYFGGMFALKSGLCFFVLASKVLFFGTWKWTLLTVAHKKLTSNIMLRSELFSYFWVTWASETLLYKPSKQLVTLASVWMWFSNESNRLSGKTHVFNKNSFEKHVFNSIVGFWLSSSFLPETSGQIVLPFNWNGWKGKTHFWPWGILLRKWGQNKVWSGPWVKSSLVLYGYNQKLHISG